LVLRRLEADEKPEGPIGRALFAHFCQDLDANLREMGVGDLTVPRRMNDMASAFYGRNRVYRDALAAQDRDLCAAALARNVFGEVAPGHGARRLADYMLEVAAVLDRVPFDAIARGDFQFPNAVLPTGTLIANE
jgi:cytochrome b pre-mRNA-processing protein 3